MRTDCWLIGSHDTHNSTADKAAQITGSHLSLGNHNSKQKNHWHCQGCWWESHQFRRYLFIRIITIHPEGSSMDWIERKQYVNVYTQFVCADRLTGLIERAAAKAAFWKKFVPLDTFPEPFPRNIVYRATVRQRLGAAVLKDAGHSDTLQIKAEPVHQHNKVNTCYRPCLCLNIIKCCCPPSAFGGRWFGDGTVD